MQQPGTNASLVELPIDLQNLIWQQLHPVDLLAVATTCKDLQSALQKTEVKRIQTQLHGGCKGVLHVHDCARGATDNKLCGPQDSAVWGELKFNFCLMQRRCSEMRNVVLGYPTAELSGAELAADASLHTLWFEWLRHHSGGDTSRWQFSARLVACWCNGVAYVQQARGPWI